MALRYFQQQEQSYVPTYTPLNAEILSNTHQQIQAQGAKTRQYKRDTFDVAADNVASTLSNLDQRDQQYAREQFAQSRKNLRQIMEEQGARNAMPFIDEEVNRISTELQPLKNIAQIKQKAVKQLSENENVPTSVKNSILQGDIGGVYDEEGNLVEAKADINENDLSVAANWEDMNEFMQDFNSKARKANIEEGRFDPQGKGFTTRGQTGQETEYRRIVEAINGDDLMYNNMRALMSNPKMREQLSLLAKTRLNREDPNITVDDEGRVHETTYIPKTNEKGEYLDKKNRVVEDYRKADVEKKTVPYQSAVQWQAAKLAKPYAERDSYYRSKYETQKVTGQKSDSDEMSESSIYTSKVSWKSPEVDVDDYFTKLAERVNGYENQNQKTTEKLGSTLQKFFKTNDRVKFDFEEGEVHTIVGNENLSKSQIDERFNQRINEADSYSKKQVLRRQRTKMFNRFAILEQTEAQANALDKQIHSINNGVKNDLKDSDKFRPYVDVISFSEAGEISIDRDELAKHALEEGWTEELPENAKIDPKELQNLDPGAVKKVLTTIQYGQGKQETEVEQELYVFKDEQGEIHQLVPGKGPVQDMVDSAREIQKKRMETIEDAGEFKNTIGIRLTKKPEHQEVIDMFEHGKVSPMTEGGGFTDANGNDITEDDFSATKGDRFVPTKVAMKNGSPIIIGYAQDADGNKIEDLGSLQLSGETARSVARQLYGDVNYENVISAESFKSLFPKLINDQDTVNVSDTVVNNLLNTKFNKDFKVRYKNVEDNKGERDSFRVFDGSDNYIGEASDAYSIIEILLQHYADTQQD